MYFYKYKFIAVKQNMYTKITYEFIKHHSFIQFI